MLLCQVIYPLKPIVHDDTITENPFMEMTDIFTQAVELYCHISQIRLITGKANAIAIQPYLRDDAKLNNVSSKPIYFPQDNIIETFFHCNSLFDK